MLGQVNLSILEPLLSDPEVTEIMVNSPEAVYMVKQGKLQLTGIKFANNAAILTLIQALANAFGREINEMNPLVNVRLPDGSRFNAVLPPIAINGPVLTLQKTMQKAHTWEELIGYGALNPKMLEFLQALMAANLNLVVAGGTASGKTTIINALSELIPHDERIVTIESIAELQLRHPHVISLEARPANTEGKGEITVSDLILNATMMRAERIIMAEVQGNEVWAMLQAMSSGYDGSLFGIHANSVTDVLERTEMMATAATNLPLLQIRAKIAQSIQVIVQQMRLSDGKRRIVAIAEIIGLKNNLIEIQDIMRFDGNEFRFTGNVPSFVNRLNLPADFFKG